MSLDWDSPVPVIAFPHPNLGPRKTLWVSVGTNSYFIHIELPKIGSLPFWLWCYRHEPPCEKKLRRPHSICSHCYYQKKAKGKIGEFEPVIPIIWFYRNQAANSKVRSWIIKKLEEALEFISDY
jgi:hypothetical protein